MKKIIAVIGARPQFIKHFPLQLAAKGEIILKTIHTGQHYDQEMSQIFFDDLKMDKPDFMLNVGSGNHGFQTGRMMIEIEEIFLKEKPDEIIVYGDTNSTLAGSLIASKLQIPIIHIEAGLRSYNKEMPEEINRLLTDHISDFLFVPSKIAQKNLQLEGITKNVFEVGDIMKDLVNMTISNKWFKNINVEEPFIYTTIHRPYNTDNKQRLETILVSLDNLSKKVVFPLHPRTEKLMNDFAIEKIKYSNILFVSPQGYFNNLSYLNQSEALITDSGGMQKEAYWLKKKCVTIRKETEWIETVESGWNKLLYEDLTFLEEELNSISNKNYYELYGDGKTSEKIITKIR